MSPHILKKGQVQNGETIAVVIIIIILIIVGLLFGFNRTVNDVEKRSNEQEYQNTIRVSLKARSLLEIGCSEFESVSFTCVDEYKIDALSNIIQNDIDGAYLHYFELFKGSEIQVKILYPNPRDIVLYNITDNENTTRYSTSKPVLVWNPVTKEKSFGVMEVSTFT